MRGGFHYDIPAKPTSRFKSKLELLWYKALKPLTSYLSYELLKVGPTSINWEWNPKNPARIYIADFFLKLPFDPTYHIAEVKPITRLEEFDDYLPKPKSPSHRFYLLGASDKGPGPTWRWIGDSWEPYALL